MIEFLVERHAHVLETTLSDTSDFVELKDASVLRPKGPRSKGSEERGEVRRTRRKKFSVSVGDPPIQIANHKYVVRSSDGTKSSTTGSESELDSSVLESETTSISANSDLLEHKSTKGVFSSIPFVI